MKKTFIFLLLLIGLLLVGCSDGTVSPDDASTKPVSANPQVPVTLPEPSSTDFQLFDYEITDEGVIIIGYHGDIQEIVIPSQIDGRPVVSIGSNAFSHSYLTSVVIPEGVVSIGEEAFYSSTYLLSVTLPNSLNSIDKYAFSKCAKLTQIDFPCNLATIGENAFKECQSLTRIILPEGITSIEYGAFYGCTSAAIIEIPSSVTTIANKAFSECDSVVTITLPEGLTKIDHPDAFWSCDSLANFLVVPGSYAEEWCIEHARPYTFTTE